MYDKTAFTTFSLWLVFLVYTVSILVTVPTLDLNPCYREVINQVDTLVCFDW